MFIGAGGDRAQASKIANLYEGYGQDTYLKSYQVDGQAITGQAEEVTAWFTKAISHYKELLQLSVDGLGSGSLLTNDRLTQLTQSTDSLQAERDQAFTHLPQAVQVHALAVGDNLVLAGDKLSSYIKTSDKKDLWQSQQALLDALVEYDQVVQALQ
jgi:stage II sporulation protein B